MERLLDYFVPGIYALDLNIDKFKKTIDGRVSVHGKVLSTTIKFHAVNLNVSNILIRGKTPVFTVNNDILEITLDDSLVGQDFTIHIYYSGKLNENMQGAYLSTYEYNGNTETIVATQFESHYAREAFPCIDEPAAKAEFRLNITVPKVDDEIVISNVAATQIEEGNGKIKYHFADTPRMSTYLLAWVIGKFHGKTITNEHGVEITTYCALNQDVNSVDFANEVAAKSLEFYDDNFKIPYPLKKLVQVALPDFEAGAMENWGLVTYRESMLLVGKSATIATRKTVALTVAHELSHQWFGDLVTMEWWDDLWLNESFASVMEYFAVDYIYPKFQIFERFFTGDCFAALVRDAYMDVQSVHQEVHDPAEIATLFDGAIVYSKGAHLMLMLIRLMGWDNFCKGVSEYFEKHKYHNTVGDDLWEALNKYAKFDTNKLMHTFIDRPGYPVISYDGDGYSQKRFLLDSNKMPEMNWPLPEVTEDMSGHYILNLTDAEFEERLNNFDKLGLEEKLRLLIDRSLVCRTSLAASASLVPLIVKFKNESSASVWEIVAVIVGQLKTFFEPDSDEEKSFKKFVGNLVVSKLTEIGLTTREDDDENTLRLRAVLLGLDYYAETSSDLEKLAEMYKQDYTKVDKEIRDTIFAAKIHEEPKMLDEYLKAYIKESDPEIKDDLMMAMTLIRDEKNIDKMIGLLSDYKIVKPQDQLFLFIRLYRNSKMRDKSFSWLVSHWDEIKKMMGDKSLDSYPRYTANIIRTEAEFNAWQDFFKPMKDESALSRAIQIGEKEIKARLELIKQDRNAVVTAIDNYSEKS